MGILALPFRPLYKNNKEYIKMKNKNINVIIKIMSKIIVYEIKMTFVHKYIYR